MIALFTCVIAGGCSKSEFHKQLADIDLLLQQQKNEEASKLLNEMNKELKLAGKFIIYGKIPWAYLREKLPIDIKIPQ